LRFSLCPGAEASPHREWRHRVEVENWGDFQVRKTQGTVKALWNLGVSGRSSSTTQQKKNSLLSPSLSQHFTQAPPYTKAGESYHEVTLPPANDNDRCICARRKEAVLLVRPLPTRQQCFALLRGSLERERRSHTHTYRRITFAIHSY